MTAEMDVASSRRSALRARLTSPAALAILIFAAASSYCAIRSQGFISGDACIHYFAARYAFAHPRNFVDVWSRPVVTTLDAIPAWLAGRVGVRLVSMLVAIGCGIVAMHLARGQRIRQPVLALLFTLGQPLLFLHSFSEMTELPFALLLGLAFLAFQQRRYWLATVLVSWTPLARPEGFVIVALVGGAMLWRRDWLRLPLLPLPLVLWDIVGWLLSDHKHAWWRWLKESWPYAGESMYGHGSAFAFLLVLPMVISPLLMPAMIMGMAQSLPQFPSLQERLTRPRGRAIPVRSHIEACIFLTAALPLFILVGHSLLYWAGKMASAGEARYLLVVAPMWGVLAARGWEWFFDRFALRYAVAIGALAVALPPIIVNAIYSAVPVPYWHDWTSARAVAAWYQASPLRPAFPKITTSHPGVYYFLDVNPYNSPMIEDWGKTTLHKCPPGTLLIWDPVFGSKNASGELTMTLDEIHAAVWVEVPDAPSPMDVEAGSENAEASLDAPQRHWHVFVSSKQAQ